ncbi:hypothetical protein D9M71_771210 [compost metagenome]
MKFRLLIPREAESHKPFPVKLRGHPLQQLDTAAVIFDQIVVSGENGRDFLLQSKIRATDLNFFKYGFRDNWSVNSRVVGKNYRLVSS